MNDPRPTRPRTLNVLQDKAGRNVVVVEEPPDEHGFTAITIDGAGGTLRLNAVGVELLRETLGSWLEGASDGR